MMRTYKSTPDGQVATAADTWAETRVVYRAKVEVFTPSPDGGSYVSYLYCDHSHTSEAAAKACADRRAAGIRRERSV
jgi:LmbE family N-acetylglucosaminyl deacetylase